MGRQKKKSRSLQSFETLGGNENRFIGVNYTLYFHSSYMSLTDKQQKLYNCMSSVRFNMTPNEREYIHDTYGDDESLFFFSEARWRISKADSADRKYYNFMLYNNLNQFYKDRNALIEHGLIEIVESNKHRKCKNLYRLSDKWKGMEFKKESRHTPPIKNKKKVQPPEPPDGLPFI